MLYADKLSIFFLLFHPKMLEAYTTHGTFLRPLLPPCVWRRRCACHGFFAPSALIQPQHCVSGHWEAEKWAGRKGVGQRKRAGDFWEHARLRSPEKSFEANRSCLLCDTSTCIGGYSTPEVIHGVYVYLLLSHPSSFPHVLLSEPRQGRHWPLLLPRARGYLRRRVL